MTEGTRIRRKHAHDTEQAAPVPVQAPVSGAVPALGHDFSQVSINPPSAEGQAAPQSAAPVTISQVAPLSVQGGWLGDAFAAIGGAIDTAVSAIGNLVGGTTPTTAPGAVTWPQIITINGEKVEVGSEAEQKDAERIFKDVKDKYAIEISSLSGVEAIKKDYDQVPEGVRNGLQTKEWKYKELKALERALGHYAPILGKNRAKSNLAGTEQGVTNVSKVKQGIDENSASGVLDTTTLGEYFASSKNFSIFEALESADHNFPGENEKQIEGTTAHEIGHALLGYALPEYVKTLDYWTDENTASGKADAEAPITDYGTTNASEDLSESAKFFFVEPEKLKAGRGQPAGQPGNPCPKRYQFMEDLVSKWTPPVGDFPMPEQNPDTMMA